VAQSFWQQGGPIGLASDIRSLAAEQMSAPNIAETVFGLGQWQSAGWMIFSDLAHLKTDTR
jgi:hypothetical protein